MIDLSRAVKLGITCLLESERDILDGAGVGLIANAASVDEQQTPAASLLLNSGIRLKCLFSPEHGYKATAGPGAEVPDSIEEETGLPIRSLYDKTREPTEEMLADIDAILFDLQDVGVRCYTYIWTMARAMQVAALFGKLFVVLDRPNPIGGLAVQGPVLDPQFAGFLGMYPVPLRHGMTVGELALLFNDAFNIGANLAVIRMKGWRRRLWFADTGLKWLPPSPAIRSGDCALMYAGTCLFEGTNISEGRGTSAPFCLIGAPWLDPEILKQLDERWLKGLALTPQRFTPSQSKYAGRECAGFAITIIEKEEVDPVAFSVALLAGITRRHKSELEWSEKHFDAVAGTDSIRQGICADIDPAGIIQDWEESHRQFERLRHKFLLYEG